MLSSLLNRLRRDAGVSTLAAPASGEPAIEPLHITDADFEQAVLQSDQPVVVDFWADWCGPCHMLAPSIRQLAKEYDGLAVVAKMDVDENGQTPQQFAIQGIPTIIFFKDGKEADRVVGVTPYGNLKAKLDALVY